VTHRDQLTTTDPNGSRSGGDRRSAPTPPATLQVDPDAPVGEGRGSAGRVAAELRPDPENTTQEPPPPTPSRPSMAATTWREEDVLTRCAITDLDVLVEHCLTARRRSASRPDAGPTTP